MIRGLCAAATAAMAVAGLPSPATNLRVEYMPAATIDTPIPRFSWVPLHPDRGSVQSAYRIQVNASGTVVWDTNRVSSNVTSGIVYGGAALTSDTSYTWAVTWWDGTGAQAAWSVPSTFLVALLNQSEWVSDWITCPVSANMNQLRTEFTLPSNAVSATLYITGLGYYRAFINGQRVGDAELDPGWTTYPQRVYYSAYEVTGLLAPGAANALAVYLGNGWPNIFPNTFNGSSTMDAAVDWAALRLSGRLGERADATNAVRKLRAQLHVTTADGSSIVILTNAGSFVSDASDAASHGRRLAQPAWVCGTGALLYDDVYNGCTWDSRAETLGWDMPGYNTAGWVPAVLAADPGGALNRPTTMTVQTFPLTKIVEVLNPLSVEEPSQGVYVMDFGQNFAGYVRLVLPAPVPANITITLRHAEVLQHPPYGPTDGNIYVGNLRSAKATDVFVTRESDTDPLVLEPMFTYHGFRYVEITGWPYQPSLEMVQGLHFRAAVEQTGSVLFPETADTLNMLEHAIVWGQGSNLMAGISSDCPQRDERKGWMGDSGLTQEEASLNYDMCAFYTYWALQMQDSQVATQYGHPPGTVPDTVPWTFGGDPGDFAWMTAFPSIVWTLWKFCGDTRVPTNMYPNLQALFNYEYAQINATGIAKTPTSYGDWCPPPAQTGGGQGPKPSGSFISASAFMNDVNHLIDIATALGKYADVAFYQHVRATTAAAYNAAFYNAGPNNYGNADGGGLQTASSAALGLGIVLPANQAAVAAALDADVVTTHAGHWSTGIFGMKFLHRALTANGYGVDAVSNLLVEGYPGFNWWFTNDLEPATTMLELPDMAYEGPGMNSRNHIMFGAVGAYLYDLAGLRQAPDSVGWSHPLLAPAVTAHPAMPFASGSIDTIAGQVAVQWQNTTGMQCVNNAPENENVTIRCPGTGNTISEILFASFGTASGSCEGFATGSCNAANSTSIITQLCVGKQSCTVPVSDTLFGDPCYGTVKYLDVLASCSLGGGVTLMATVPVNVHATVWLPYPAGSPTSSIAVSEGAASTSVFANGAYTPGTPGVTNAYLVASNNVVAVEIGSGNYVFVLSA